MTRLNWTFDGESYYAGRYRIDPCSADAAFGMHDICVDDEWLTSVGGLDRAKDWCAAHARSVSRLPIWPVAAVTALALFGCGYLVGWLG